MKNIKKISILLIASGTILASCKKEATEKDIKPETITKSSKIAKAESTSFTIEGMTCAMGCAKVIEGKLSALDGVQKATVDFDKKTATIRYDATIQTPDQLSKIVEAVADGKTYKVSNIKTESL